MKKISNIAFSPVARSFFWFAILLGALIILLLLIFRLSGNFPSFTPTATPLPSPTTTLSGDFYFSENFDDGSADGFVNKVGLWNVVKDESLNNVLEVNSKQVPEYPKIEFGNAAWKNFIFQTKIRIVDYAGGAPLASVHFYDHYLIAFTPFYGSVDLVYESPWKVLAGRTLGIKKNEWYSLRIETNDSEIKVFMDNTLIINEKVASNYAGAFGFSGWPGVILQFDDIFIGPNQ